MLVYESWLERIWVQQALEERQAKQLETFLVNELYSPGHLWSVLEYCLQRQLQAGSL